MDSAADPEEPMPAETVDFVSAFLAGEVTDADYLNELYTGSLLNELRSWNGPPFTRGNPLSYLLDQDISTTSGRLNTLDLLSTWLRAHGREPSRAVLEPTKEDFDVLLAAQPAWADVREDVVRQMLLKTRGLSKADRVVSVKREIAKKYRSLRRPPHWLQDPQWPVSDGVPAIFVGQHDITPLRHDHAVLYVFLVESTGAAVTVEQAE